MAKNLREIPYWQLSAQTRAIVDDADARVRARAAARGLGLDKLERDADDSVRAAVAARRGQLSA